MCDVVLRAPAAHSCQWSSNVLEAEGFKKALCCCSEVSGEETCPYQLASNPCGAGVQCRSVALRAPSLQCKYSCSSGPM